MTAKEIWYAWGGLGHPPIGVKKALCQCMVLIDDEKYLGSIESACDWLGTNPFIQVYTLGETRERAECECCEDWNCKGLRCDICQGRGYIWRVQQCMK